MGLGVSRLAPETNTAQATVPPHVYGVELCRLSPGTKWQAFLAEEH